MLFPKGREGFRQSPKGLCHQNKLLTQIRKIPHRPLHTYNQRSGSRIRCVSETLFVVHLFASVQPRNACPPEGPEALQACSLFQGTKAWLEPRLEHLLNSSRRSRGREAPFCGVRTSIVCSLVRLFACAEPPSLMNSGVNKRPERLQGVQRAATRPKWAAERCFAA